MRLPTHDHRFQGDGNSRAFHGLKAQRGSHLDDASLVTCGGDGGNRTRVRGTRPGTSTSVVGLLSLARGVAADRATPGPSRWEPKLPLEHSYRRRSATRRLFDARPPAHRRETGADVTVLRSVCPQAGLGYHWGGSQRGLWDGNPSVIGTLEFVLRC